MTEDVSDYALRQSKPGSLPPAAKTFQQAGYVVIELAALGAALLGARWEVMSHDAFSAVVLGILIGNYALRTGRTLDAQTMAALLRR